MSDRTVILNGDSGFLRGPSGSGHRAMLYKEVRDVYNPEEYCMEVERWI